jgi:dipeptidyl aminopeptidase/acylaminoacyl peptidase
MLNPRRPESNRLLAEVSGGGWAVLDWSPDGSQVVAVSLVSANSSELHQVEVNSGRMRRVSPVTTEAVSYTDAAFLPDGRELLVITDHGSDHRRLARLNPETGALVHWGPELAWGVDEFDLSADGRVAAILTNEDGWSVLRLIDASTGAEIGRPRNLNGVASGLRWHPGRREVGMTLSSARTPGDVVSVDSRVNALTRWTDGTVAGVRSSRFVEPELVRVKSFDGLSVSGLLYRPDSRRFPGPRPVVLHLHGGPEGQSRPQFLRAWNYVVQEMGVALLYPNVRGSEGYGKRFLTLDDGVRREDAVRDVGAFLDWMGGRSDLDAGRVAIYGGSYGGYMVLASLAHFGERLRCGIDVVGISNFRTFLENTQEYRRDLRRAEYGDERDPTMAAFLERISPLNQAHRIRRPLLVVQGRNDPRVPITESEQMVRAIRDQGGTVGYLMAKDEGHGFTRKQNADFLFLTMVEFLERHLLND